MRIILNLLHEGDVCALPLLILLLIVVGTWMAGIDSRVRKWSKRAAATAFVAYGIYAFIRFHPSTTVDFLGLVVRSLLAAGLMLGVSWISLAVATHTWRIVTEIQRSCRRVRPEAVRADSTTRDDQERRRQESETQRVTQESQRQQTNEEANARRRRARSNVALAFHRLRYKLGDLYTEASLKEHFATLMQDSQPPSEVEENGLQLINLLNQLVADAAPISRPRSITEIAQRHEREKAALKNASDIDDQLKRILDQELDEKFEEEIRHYTRDNRP